MGPSMLIDRPSLGYDLAMIVAKHGLIYDTTIVSFRAVGSAFLARVGAGQGPLV